MILWLNFCFVDDHAWIVLNGIDGSLIHWIVGSTEGHLIVISITEIFCLLIYLWFSVLTLISGTEYAHSLHIHATNAS